MFLNKHPLAAKADLSSLRLVFNAAAPLGHEMVDEFHAKHPKCRVSQGETDLRYTLSVGARVNLVRSAAVSFRNAASSCVMQQRQIKYHLAAICMHRKALTCRCQNLSVGTVN